MAQEVISDFLIKFGFDAKNVEKGLRNVNKLLDKVEKKIKKIPSSFHMTPKIKEPIVDSNVVNKKQKTTPQKTVKPITDKPELQHKGVIPKNKPNPTPQLTQQPVQDAHVKRMQQQLALQERLNGKTEAYLQTIRVRKSIEAGLTNPERIRQELSMAKNAADYQKIRTRLTTNMSVQQSALNKKLKEQNYLMQRVNQSSKQLVGNYISAFAAVGVLSNVTTIGQDFESINATFKAVSENAQVAGENLQFVRDETMRLGLSYKEASKGFSQMLASNQGQMQLNEVKELFIGVSEAGTLLGLSADDQAGSLRALQQMLSKTKVSAKLFGHLYGNIYLQPL